MIIETIARNYFGHQSLRPNQKVIISSILSHKDTLSILPTGGGKSLCYQVAAMCLPGVTIVISPLISLMQDQIQHLIRLNIPSAAINSTVSKEQTVEILRDASMGKLKLLYVTPERLSNSMFFEYIKKCQISMITIDEAHCLSQWGHNFRKDYLKIPDFLEKLNQDVVISAFTATANKNVENDILNILKLKTPEVFRASFDRPNLYLQVKKTRNKYAELIKYIKSAPEKSGIVYCSTRKDVSLVYSKLLKDGIRAVMYHGGMTENERALSQDKFIYNSVPVMIATNAFGMGIDKSDVKYVIHYNMPLDMESYYQEIGRAGRDGKQADCMLLYSPADYKINLLMIQESKEFDKINRLNQMADYCNTNKCLRNYIKEYFEGVTSYLHECNSCSNCCNLEMQELRIKIESKIIECIKELPRAYGKTMICEILTGEKNERIIKLRFNRLSSYGKLKKQKAKDIYDALDKMIKSNQLAISAGEYPTIKIME